MKKMLLLLFFPVLWSPIFSQNGKEPDQYKNFFKQFTNDFNSENWKNIAANSSATFLKSVPENRLTEFLSGLKRDFGKIASSKFKKFDDRQSAVYHVELDKTWFNFFLKLDSNDKMIGLVVLNPNYNEDLPMKKNQTKMQLPFDGEWFVFWGGDKEDQNYHVANRAQKNAFDIVIYDSLNRSFKTNGRSNEDYYAFGQKLYAPCKGEVIEVIDGVPDNIPGQMNPARLTGNTVIIKTANDEFVLMAHMKLNSVAVSKGQKLEAGQYVGLCGNSGNSSEPHLHLHIMDKPEMKNATGIKCYFDKLSVNGKNKTNYSPVKGDRIRK